MAKVELLESAYDDIDYIISFFKINHNVKRGNEVIDLIFDSYEQLNLFPESHPKVRDPISAEHGFRMAICKEYISFYRYEENDTVVIYHIVSAKQNYSTLLRRYIE